jgi:3-vinyl bacteriochlorophyllide hydratase
MPTDTMDGLTGPQLYTTDQRARRDATVWTVVQGVLAPVQFLVFLVSVALVIRYLMSGAGYEAATISIIAKTLLLLTIMITGAIWEKVVFGQWLFAPAFFWEDVFSFGVIALHLTYVWALLSGWPAGTQMWIALAAYAAYIINAGQFLWKLRQARLGQAQLEVSA